MTAPKHLTAATSIGQEVEKLHRYTFLDKDSTANVEKYRKGNIIREIKFPSEHNGLFSVKFDRNGSHIIASFGTGVIEIYNVDSGEVKCTVRSTPQQCMPIMSVRCVPRDDDDGFFAAGISGHIYKCSCEENSCALFAEEKQNEINTIDINISSDTLVSGGKDAAIRVYDMETGKLKQKWYKKGRYYDDNSTTQFHAMRIFAIKCHNMESNVFLSGGWDDIVKIWDIRVKEGSIRSIKGPHICGDALDVKDSHVLTGSWTVDNSVQIWEMNSGKLINNVNPINRVQSLDGEFLYCCQYFRSTSQPDTILAGGSGTGHLEIISLKDIKILNAYRVHKTIQAVDSNAESHIVFGGMETAIKVVKL